MYKIIHLKEEGYSMREIAAKVPCGLSTVVRTLKRFSETNFIADRGRSGRPRKTSLREDKFLLSNRKLNYSQILKQWNLTSNVSAYPRTVRGRLLEIGLRGCKARPKSLLTKFQHKRRLTWASEHSLWTIKYWVSQDNRINSAQLGSSLGIHKNCPKKRSCVIHSLREKYEEQRTLPPVPWPPHMPDVTPLDFFLWGYFKELVYRDVVTTKNGLSCSSGCCLYFGGPHVLRHVMTAPPWRA
ncbi:uncharacterized protein TNCV_2912751 [Trichonephila clavipes]|nr:uncharacterized protein TNCV_2912751 [Trichonephila clavipes]